MPTMNLNYPSIVVKKNNLIYVSVVVNNHRYRLSSGKKIGSDIYPNTFPISERYNVAKVLCSEVYNYLLSGGTLDGTIPKNLPDIEYLKLALDSKLKENISKGYKKNLTYVFNEVKRLSKGSNVTSKSITIFLGKYTSATSYNSIRKHLKVLVNKAIDLGMNHNPLDSIKSRKAKAVLHKPFKDINLVLEEIKQYNSNLYLCCLITYGCLLRPHREVRNLTYGDFSNELDYIHLSGDRNKSGRVRSVPVPLFVREHLGKQAGDINIFTNTKEPLNEGYFKTLWSRFKSVSKTLGSNQTLYSMRHSGAINIYEKTKDLGKLQTAMGHASLSTSLIYLRGLEVSQLTASDMPTL